MLQQSLRSLARCRTRVLLRFGPAWGILGAYMFLAGCAPSISVGIATIPPTQYLTQEVPQTFQLKAPAEQVWQIVSARAKSSDSCVLTNAPKDWVLSWGETAERWRDLGQDSVAVMHARFAQEPGKGMSITTVWIQDLDSGCALHIRKVYYGAASFEGVGHSRGEDERALYQHILYRLEMGEGKSQSREEGDKQ